MVVLDLGGGRRLHLDPDDARAQTLLSTGGAFNAPSKEMWRRLLASGPWDLIVDVGSNYGEMLLEIPPDSGATIIAFEPNPTLLPYLERTVADSGLTVEIAPLALSDVTGTAEFLVDTAWSGTSRLATATDVTKSPAAIDVATTTLDAFFGHARPAHVCIKIDVEGAEELVLAGGRSLFARVDDVAVMVEVLHLPSAVVAELAERWRLYLFDLRTKRLVRVGPDVEHIDRLLQSGWCYFQDAILVPLGPGGRRPW